MTSALQTGHYEEDRYQMYIHHRQDNKTDQLLPLYQPLIYLIEVEYVATRQYPYFVTFDKVGQADSTFELGFKPGSKSRIETGMGGGRIVVCTV